MVAFMDTVATIPTGAMAERWKWKAFVGWGLFCGALYYPIFAAWTWGGGWLAKTWDSMSLGAGYVDFAGSGVVHTVGGVAALAGALVLGPRIGKFNRDGTPNTPPHPHGHAWVLHPAVRLVRVQRRLDAGRHRRAVRGGGRQHRHRRGVRRRRGHVRDDAEDR
jgi:ammonia channel protein AmtB